MIKYFKTFFNPTIVTYSYNQPKELIIAKIAKVLDKKVTLLSFKDMTGSFLDSNTFSIKVISPAFTLGSIVYGSTLVGHVMESMNGMTQIKTKVRPSLTLYCFFFTTVIIGFISLYKFIETGSTNYLFWSLFMIVGGTAFSLGFSNVAIAAIRERFKMYIDKELTI